MIKQIYNFSCIPTLSRHFWNAPKRLFFDFNKSVVLQSNEIFCMANVIEQIDEKSYNAMSKSKLEIIHNNIIIKEDCYFVNKDNMYLKLKYKLQLNDNMIDFSIKISNNELSNTNLWFMLPKDKQNELYKINNMIENNSQKIIVL